MSKGSMRLTQEVAFREVDPGLGPQDALSAMVHTYGSTSVKYRMPSLTKVTRTLKPGKYKVEEVSLATTVQESRQRFAHWCMVVLMPDGSRWGAKNEDLIKARTKFTAK